MSDDLLQRELSRLSRQAEAMATLPTPDAVVGRAKARRRRRRMAAVAMPVVIAALVVGVVVARGPAGHQVDVSSSAAGGAGGGANGASGRHAAAGGVARTGSSHRLSTHGAASAQPVPSTSEPASVRGNGPEQFGRCVAGRQPKIANGAPSQGQLRAGPVSVTAVWKQQGAGIGGCGWTETTAGAPIARRLLTAIQATKSEALPSCPAAAAEPGSVELVFSYRQGPTATVTMTLGSCSTLTLPGQVTREASTVSIKALNPPAWVSAGLLRRPLPAHDRSSASGSSTT